MAVTESETGRILERLIRTTHLKYEFDLNKYHLVLWLVMLAVDVFVLASGLLHQGAHALRFADNARILGPSRFAAL